MLNKAPRIFDRSLVRFRRHHYVIDQNAGYLKLLNEISQRIVERMKYVKRDFIHAVQIGSDTGIITQSVQSSGGEIFIADSSPKPLGQLNHVHVACDDEQLPFKENSFDLIISMMTAHWINDLPGFFKQCLWSLKPDGWFITAMIGEDSLTTTKNLMMHCDIEHHHKAFQRFLPTIRTKDAGKLLQRAGFALPIADVDRIQIQYDSIDSLLNDIRSSGQANACYDRRVTAPILKTQMEMLRNLQVSKELTLDLEIVFLSGWKACPNTQQKPLNPGEFKTHLTQVL